MCDEVRAETGAQDEWGAPVKSELDIGDTVLQHSDLYFKRAPKREPGDADGEPPRCDKSSEADEPAAAPEGVELNSGREPPGDSSRGPGVGKNNNSKKSHSSDELEDNETESTASGRYICGICHQTFKFEKSLNRHFVTHRKYRCDICNQSFDSNNNLNDHKTNVHSRPYQCDVCNISCCNLFNLKSHILTHFGNVHECNICLRPFGVRSSLIQHKASGVCGEKPSFQCAVCTKSLKCGSSLRKHMQQMHELFSECRVCHKFFKQKQMLFAHKKTCHPYLGVYKCSLCSKSFDSNSKLCRHNRDEHRGTRSYKCDICSRTFMTKGTIVRHIKFKHRHVLLRKRKCQFCQQSFDTKIQLNQHRSTTACGKKFVDSENRKIERNSVNRNYSNHSDTRLYECEVCRKSFKLDEYFTHFDSPLLKCDVCDKSFKFKRVLDQHKLVRHPIS